LDLLPSDNNLTNLIGSNRMVKRHWLLLFSMH
jgi:hypothetical protein